MQSAAPLVGEIKCRAARSFRFRKVKDQGCVGAGRPSPPIRPSRAAGWGTLSMLRFYAEEAIAIHGETIKPIMPGRNPAQAQSAI